jgi:hypothetical protein
MGLAVALIPRQRITKAAATPGTFEEPPGTFEEPPAAYQARWAAPRTIRASVHGSGLAPPARTARQRDERLMMQVVLDDVFLASLRRALFSASAGLITLLRVQPDPRDAHRVKVWLGMNRPAVRAVIDLIIATLPEAEIGRIAPA